MQGPPTGSDALASVLEAAEGIEAGEVAGRPAYRSEVQQLARDRTNEEEFWNLPAGERAKALRLWKFWGAGDEALASLMARVTQHGVAGVTPDDLGKVCVAMMRAEGRRATAARQAMKMLQGLVEGGQAAALKAAKEKLRVQGSELRELRERAERAERAESNWAKRWENELGKARADEREKLRREQEAAAEREREVTERVAAGMRDLGLRGPRA